ncbi:MAG: hypothetical protein QNK82_09205 [Akkermansiaceae bacterium]
MRTGNFPACAVEGWSNDASVVGVEQAKVIRAATKERATFWIPAELR